MKLYQKIFLPAIIILPFLMNITLAGPAGGIDATYKWAWSDVAGWIDFHGPGGGVNVKDNQLKNYGFFYNNPTSYVALDCKTSPGGDVCGSSNFFVSNDAGGNLAGWAWNDAYGWISFCGNAAGGSTYNGSTWVCPGSPTYRVTIDGVGDFHGWAWNEVIGWISFNCNNSGIGNTCASSDYKVNTNWRGGPLPPVTGWLESSTFDVGVAEGVAFNSILWQGTLGSGGTTVVKFQIATANCSNGATNAGCTTNIGWGGSKTSGDGAFVGSDGTSATYYQPSGPGVPAAVSAVYHNNKRYFRYRVFLEKDAAATTPVVQDIIINWSP